MNRIFAFFIILAALTAASSCIEDGFDTSPSAQPAFSVEELDLGLQFTENPSPTSLLKIYNRNSKQIRLSEVRMRDGSCFRINVDGQSGREFHDVEIRPRDSIYVFVEVTLPPTLSREPQVVTDYLDVTTNGVLRSVPVVATAQDVVRHRGERVEGAVTFSAALPHVIFDTLRVAAGATLTLEPGAQLLFHDKAVLQVDGALVADATAENPVVMRGDRTGNVVAQISYEVMSNQWDGVRFGRGSRGNRLSHVEIKNTCNGVALDSLVELDMANCRLYNSGGLLLDIKGDSRVRAAGCELSNAASALVRMEGGEYLFDRCTLANYYLFKWPDMAAVEFVTPAETSARFTNSVIYGRDRAVCEYDSPEEVEIYFARCMFAVKGSDDARYTDCLWETDPLLRYSLTDYVFDYLPLPDSPVAGAAYPELDSPLLPAADRFGRPRANTLGAYAPEPSAAAD